MASIEKSKLKIGTLEQAIEGLEKQLKSCKNTEIAVKGAEDWLNTLAQSHTGFVDSLRERIDDPESPITESNYDVVKSFCGGMLNTTLSMMNEARGQRPIMKGKQMAVSDSIEMFQRQIKHEGLKIQNELNKKAEAEEVETCDICEVREPIEDETQCIRCKRHMARWGKMPSDKTLEKWRAEDG